MSGSRAGTSGGIPCVALPKGRESPRRENIENIFGTFFFCLYTSKQNGDPCCLASAVLQFCGDLPGVPAEVNEGLRRPASRVEVSEALRSMRTGFALNPHGLLTEFYSTF